MDEISAVRSGVASCQQVTNARKRRENSDCVCDLQVVSKLNKNLVEVIYYDSTKNN